MCFWQWLVQNKEIIMVLSNTATVIALIFIGLAFIFTASSFKIQRRGTQASIFHSITAEINAIISEQKKCEKNGDDAVINWYQRLINAFEYYALFANRKYLSKEMRTFYRGALISYVNWAKDYPDAEIFFKKEDRKKRSKATSS